MTVDPAETRRLFDEAVNMAPAALRKWLDTRESKGVGMTPGGGLKSEGARGHSVGRHMGKRIIAIKAKKAGDLDEQDYADMRKVVGYVHRHTNQRPEGDVTNTKWRWSLMNWGHDPLK